MPAWQGLQSVSRGRYRGLVWRAHLAELPAAVACMSGCAGTAIEAALFRGGLPGRAGGAEARQRPRHAAGHGMTVGDFLASAEVAAPRYRRRAARRRRAHPGGGRGDPGRLSGRTPISASCCSQRRSPRRPDGRRRAAAGLAAMLAGRSTVDDAVLAYRAIRLAAPGGLGRSAQHDVARGARRSRCWRRCAPRPSAIGSPGSMPPASRDVFDTRRAEAARLPGRRLDRGLGD